jgi:lipid A 3-O-deacylase
MIVHPWLRAGLLLALLSSGPAAAVDGVAFEAGEGEGVKRIRAAVQWDWKRQWFRGANWHVGGYWDLSIGQWHDDDVAPGQREDITDVGFTPVFRIQPNGLRGPYVEAGIGAHLLTHTSIGDKRMSTKFQFGDHIGVGYRFGDKGAFDVGYRFQHHSNAGIKKPNPGINFHQVRVQYHF